MVQNGKTFCKYCKEETKDGIFHNKDYHKNCHQQFKKDNELGYFMKEIFREDLSKTIKRVTRICAKIGFILVLFAVLFTPSYSLSSEITQLIINLPGSKLKDNDFGSELLSIFLGILFTCLEIATIYGIIKRIKGYKKELRHRATVRQQHNKRMQEANNKWRS